MARCRLSGVVGIVGMQECKYDSQRGREGEDVQRASAACLAKHYGSSEGQGVVEGHST